MDDDTAGLQAAELTRVVFDATSALVLVTDAAGTIHHCNRACERLSGHSAAELRGEAVWDRFVTPSERHLFERRFRAWLTNGGAEGAYAAVVDTAGGRPCRLVWSASLVSRDGVRQVILTGIDMSAPQAVQSHRRESLRGLEQAACRGAVGEVLGELAHELNQPLSAVLNFSRGALRLLERGAEPDVRDVLERIGGQSERAALIVSELRHRLRGTAEASTAVDMNALAQEAVALLGSEADVRGIGLELTLPARSGALSGDPQSLLQLLIQLLRNAMDAVGQGGRVHLMLAPDGEGVELVVHDNGPGVPEGNREQIFDLFFTTKPGRLGMGLPLCRRIVRAHGGEIAVLPDAGHGCTVRCTLRGAADAQTPEPATRNPKRGR